LAYFLQLKLGSSYAKWHTFAVAQDWIAVFIGLLAMLLSSYELGSHSAP
jgi:hypothetical protein